MKKITISLVVIVSDNISEQNIVDSVDKKMQDERGVYVINRIRVEDVENVNNEDY